MMATTGINDSVTRSDAALPLELVASSPLPLPLATSSSPPCVDTMTMTATAAATATAPTTAAEINSAKDDTTLLPSPIQGKNDWRHYRCIRLNGNGVTVCLVHDPASKTVGMAACVPTGATADPRNMSGLAHFVEHASMMGSTKYPGENEYKKYLAQHGGRSNAATGHHYTKYKFEILAPHAEPAIDMFAQFFVAPLFTESGTSREVQAVDSEDSKNHTDDFRRRWQILKDMADPGHYYSKFTTGNASTLPTQSEQQLQRIRAAMLAFHAYHYRPDRLCVVVVGPQSLDELHAWVVPRFAPMQIRHWPPPIDDTSCNHDTAMQDPALIMEAIESVMQGAHDAPTAGLLFDTSAAECNPAFGPEVLLKTGLAELLLSHNPSPVSDARLWPIVVTVKPLRSMRRLVLHFALPPLNSHLPGQADQSPAAVLSHLLGHEGPHSAFAVLQNAGLLSSLSAGCRAAEADFTLLEIDVGLTLEGEAQWKAVTDVIFQHLRLIAHAATKAAKAVMKGNQEAMTIRTPVPSPSKKLGSETGAISSEDEQLEEIFYLQELQRIWEENSKLHAIKFEQSSPGNVYDFAAGLCWSILQHGTEKCLAAGHMLKESGQTYPAVRVAEWSALLAPSNCFIERCSQSAWEEMEQLEQQQKQNQGTYDTKQPRVVRRTEPWYQIDYFVSTVVETDLKRWEGAPGTTPIWDASADLQLPSPNRYIPRTLDLCADLPAEAKQGPRLDHPLNPPQLLVCEDNRRLWHRLDDRYALPKAVLTLLLRNAATEHVRHGDTGVWEHDIVATVHSSILSGMFAEAMAQDTYDARLAGLRWSIALGGTGIRFDWNGFSDRLSDLSVFILHAFLNGDFIQQSYLAATKDRVLRNLRTYFTSRRADAHASYYREFLLSGQDAGLDASIAAAEEATLESVKQHHARLLANKEIFVECFYTGNVSIQNARALFDAASHLIASATRQQWTVKKHDSTHLEQSASSSNMWMPGLSERRLIPGQDVELHFESKNDQEENGATLVTYQSTVPGFRGAGLSTAESLKNTAAVRMISQMLREPVKNELRTKQTLGYLVSSYYDIGFSSAPPNESVDDPFVIPIDYITIDIMGRKVAPLEVIRRIDDFLVDFRKTLVIMPQSEIDHHAAALSAKLLKPIQKLADEASTHFSKIRRFAPEIIASGGKGNDIPWDNAPALAGSIRSLDRNDLLTAWDRLVQPQHRARIVSCVYGSTFPIQAQKILPPTNTKLVVRNNLHDLIRMRPMLPYYNRSLLEIKNKPCSSWIARYMSSVMTTNSLLTRSTTTTTTIVLGTAVVVAAVAMGVHVVLRTPRSKNVNR